MFAAKITYVCGQMNICLLADEHMFVGKVS